MIYASGLPYAPHMYEIIHDVITLTASTQVLARLDMARVGLYVELIGGALPGGVYYTSNSTGLNAIVLTNTSVTSINLNWYTHFTITGSELWINDAGIGNQFSVTEVRINMSRIEEIVNATRKPETLRAKIQRYFSNNNRSS